MELTEKVINEIVSFQLCIINMESGGILNYNLLREKLNYGFKKYQEENKKTEEIDWDLIIKIEEEENPSRVQGHLSRIKNAMKRAEYTNLNNEEALKFYKEVRTNLSESRNFGRRSLKTLKKYLERVGMIDE